jgi:hypothetical protein
MARMLEGRAQKRPPAKRSRRAGRVQSLAGDPSAAFSAFAGAALQRGEPDAVADEQLRKVLAAAVKVYAAKVERRGAEIKPFNDGVVTPTEAVVAACAMIRAADLNLFDVAMWFHRAASIA